MKLKIKLSLVFFIVFSFLTYQKTFSQCFQIESVLVDACDNGLPQPDNDEGFNEMVRFKVGNSPLNVSNLDVNWPTNGLNWQGVAPNALTTSKVAALNASIQSAGGCGRLIQPTSGILPANAKVVLVTSYNFSVTSNVFGAITEDIYIIFQDNATTTTGHFANYNTAAGLRTLSMSFGGGCTDAVTYDRTKLININGGQGGSNTINNGATVNFAASGTATYFNDGCSAPVEVFDVNAGNSPISACPGATVSLTGTAVGQQSVVWSVTPNGGSFSAANSLSTNYTISPSASGTITLTLTATNSCNATKTSTVTLNVNSSVIPTFNAVAPICPGGNLNPLPTTSTNNITGSWSPSLNNNATTTYTFTPDLGQCASSANLTINVNSSIVPLFNAVDPICKGDNIAPLPTTSTNNVTGLWSPAIDNSATTTYTFTPTVGQCASTVTLTITIIPSVVPTFNAIPPICSGETLAPLPTTSLNNVSGTWSPALNNTTTTTYTFTPNSSASPATNLIVNGDFSSGNTGFSSDYQFFSSVGVNGAQKAYGVVTAANSWFQFFPACTGRTPTSGNIMVVDGSTSNSGNDKVWGQTITVVPNQNYTFSYWLQTVATPNPAIIDVTINGVSIATATAPSVNCQWVQYSYVWNSGSNTTAQIAMYDRVIISDGNDFAFDDISFTPNYVQCSVSTTLTITVNPGITPLFDSVAPICSGGTLNALPTTSTNGISGTWSPTLDNTTTTTYIFTSNAGQCAANASLTIVVNPNIVPSFDAVASICSGANLNVLPTTSTNGILGSWSPTLNNTQTTTYTFTPNSGQCTTTTTLTIVVNPVNTPTFSAIPPVCSGANLNPLPTTSINNITGVWSPALNDSETTTYTFTPDVGQCAIVVTQTIVISNPSVSITANCVDTDYTLTALASDSEVSYAWYKGTTLLSETSNKLIVKATDTYKVVINSEGCTAESTENVTSFYCDIPRGISPNNDKKNDYFDLTNFQVSKLEIFNRYGMKVYSKTNYQNEWYGTSDDGQELPDATYYYVIEFESGKSKTGWVYINR